MNKEIYNNIILNEQIVLSCLLDNKILYKYLPQISIKYFISEKSKKIFNLLKKAYKKKIDININSLIEINNDNSIDKASLIALKENYFDTETNIEYHIEKLRLNYIRVNLYNNTLNELDELLLDTDFEINNIIKVFEKGLRELKEIKKGKNIIREGNDVYEEYIDLIDRRLDGSAFGSTGLKELDDVMSEGFLDGKITVLAAYTSLGKTTLASIFVDELIKKEKKVIYFALEPQVTSIIDILISRRFDISRTKLIKELNEFDDELLDEIEDEVYYLVNKSGLLHFVDNPIIEFEDIEELLKENNYALCVIDLFEKFKDIPSGETKIISEYLDIIQTIAKKTNTHIIIIQQLGRSVIKRNSKRPVLSDLMNSSKYEQIADNILLLHREKYYNPDVADEDILEIIIAKQRAGAKDISVYYYFKPEKGKLIPILKNKKEFEDSREFG